MDTTALTSLVTPLMQVWNWKERRRSKEVSMHVTNVKTCKIIAYKCLPPFPLWLSHPPLRYISWNPAVRKTCSVYRLPSQHLWDSPVHCWGKQALHSINLQSSLTSRINQNYMDTWQVCTRLGFSLTFSWATRFHISKKRSSDPSHQVASMLM
jgi:hypothetical protein